MLDGSGKPFFQGWAIVDNVGDEDWSDVALSLVSGSPVSFIQPIQQPLYRYRPVIRLPEDLNLTPQSYEAALGGEVGGVAGAVPGGVAGGIGPGSGGGIGAGSGFGVGPGARGELPAIAPAGPVTTLSDAISKEDSGIKTAATGAEVGDLFEYRIDQPVTVRRNRSALIPILQTRMEGERVSIYNESAQKDRPMRGLRLKNTSPLTLEGGSLTVIEGDAYAGEALIERLKPGEERFISYALDLGTLVTARSQDAKRPTFLVRTVKGFFEAHYYTTQTKTYTIANQTDKPRVIYVEHPVREDWRLSDETRRPVEKTANYYRFRVELGPRATVELPVVERLALMDKYQISNLTPREIELFTSNGYLDAEAKKALEKIIEIKSRIASLDSAIAETDWELSEISADQNRLRENIKALKETPEAKRLIARYVAKVGEQESRVEQLRSERRKTGEERLRLQGDLDASVKALSIERKF